LITLDHIRNLSATELRIMSYMVISGKELEISQTELAKEINTSFRQLNMALQSLSSKGIISYERGYNLKDVGIKKGKITWN
jgi:predicted transcriptional regulator